MEERRLFKDKLARPEVERIADAIQTVSPAFPRSRFIIQATDGLSRLELKGRVRHIIEALRICLPTEFPDAAAILHELPDVFESGGSDGVFNGFAAWPLIDYVGACGTGHPDIALPLLKRLTPLFSAEFSIRPFIRNDPEGTLRELTAWTSDPDHHVRRLVSEGTRPRLPWGMRLDSFVKDPGPLIPLLNALRDDPSEYVRRSVANNLNDIAKDHSDLVISVCESWQEGATAERRKLVRHAVRTLIKDGHPGVFPLLGFTSRPRLEVGRLQIKDERIKLGGAIQFGIELVSRADKQRFVVDFAIHFVKANGSTAPKVFKLRNVEADDGDRILIRKKHPLKPITTRRYYSGLHLLAVHVNGREVARSSFTLQV